MNALRSPPGVSSIEALAGSASSRTASTTATISQLYQTHDIWHVATGWGNDVEGEVGLGGVYAAQFGSPGFFGYMLSLIFLNAIYRRADLDGLFAAFTAGYRAGKHAEPLLAVDWKKLWATPLADVRAQLRLEPEAVIGEGIRAAA